MAAGPNLLVAGVGRAGTSLLAQTLATHPHVAVTEPKETHYLAFRGRTLDFSGPEDDRLINSRALTTADRYGELFETEAMTSARVRIDASISTAFYPAEALASIEATCPVAPKVIIVLRDPLRRARSAHRYQQGRGLESVDFSTAIDDELTGRRSGWHHLWQYVSMSCYAGQVMPFLAAAGDTIDDVLIIDFDELTDRRTETLDTIGRFVGLDRHDWHDVGAVNRSGRVRFGAVGKAALRASRAPVVASAIDRLPTTAKQRLRNAVVGRPAGPPAADAVPGEAVDRWVRDLETLATVWPIPASWHASLEACRTEVVG
ncbi:sulfotransferase family protein [Ilumatobacter fluminis]|uniref:Sulfotransferase family protein n=1 Tax=Ilumatobacter fluminis TaxID=467091 RepID=A0A4R7I6Q1_9ACTN|nr:sulfotransferase [Ilumatobacter fluminis]TDT18483.1 sulfotransferase family protein [Ilumatobacter fluminis]